MLSVRLQGVHLNRSFVIWSTEEREPQRLSLSTTVEFNKCNVPGIISVGVLDAQGLSKGTAHIEFSKCVTGENTIKARQRNGREVCNIVLFIDKKGFVTTDKFDIDTLKDQCALLSQRYAPHTPIVKTAFGFEVPAAFFTRYARRPTASETSFRDDLLTISKARYGNVEMTPHMYAELLGTVMHFCVPEHELAAEDMVEAVYSAMFLQAVQLTGLDCDPTMVHFEKENGTQHVAVALYDNTTHKNYLVDTKWSSVVPISGDVPAPKGLVEFGRPTYTRVLFQYGLNGMRKVDMDLDSWWNGKCTEPFRPFMEMDTMVLDQVHKLYTEIGENTGTLKHIKASGGTSGKVLRRFAKRGAGKFLSGCRSVIASVEKNGQIFEWTEYIVFE